KKEKEKIPSLKTILTKIVIKDFRERQEGATSTGGGPGGPRYIWRSSTYQGAPLEKLELWFEQDIEDEEEEDKEDESGGTTLDKEETFWEGEEELE
nr:hypothetical protein [Tanacetum cinerariifolium]